MLAFCDLQMQMHAHCGTTLRSAVFRLVLYIPFGHVSFVCTELASAVSKLLADL